MGENLAWDCGFEDMDTQQTKQEDSSILSRYYKTLIDYLHFHQACLGIAESAQ